VLSIPLVNDTVDELDAVCSDIKTKEPRLASNEPLSNMVVPLEIKAMFKSPLV
jgi:hypothetical protein